MDMGTEDGVSRARLIKQLQSTPEIFDFFQAVRLIQNLFLKGNSTDPVKLIGQDVHLSQSILRFRSHQSLSFSASEITRIRAELDSDEAIRFFEMTVSFIGLTGPNGVLPEHYTSLVIERSHTRNKDDTLRDFLDQFNHRTISFFYQAWQKYRLPYVYERNRLSGQGEDSITTALTCLTGHGEQGLRNRSSFRDEVLLFYSGFFANQTRTAEALGQMLSTYFRVQASVLQFCERWIYLSPENQSSFPNQKRPSGQNLALGNNAIIGSRFRDRQSMFRIQIGPLRWVEFLKFLPGMSEMKSIVELTHRFASQHLDFEIQLLVRADRVPPMAFGLESSNPLSLGQTTWLGTPQPDRILDDVCFRYGFGGRPFE